MLHENNRKAESLWEFSLNQENSKSDCKAWQTVPHLLLKLRAKSSQKQRGYNHILKPCPEVDFRCAVLNLGDSQFVKYSVTFLKPNLILKKISSHLLNLTCELHPLPSFFVGFQVMNLSQISASQAYHAVMERKMQPSLQPHKASPAPNYSVWLQISCSLEKLAICRDSRGNKCRDGDERGRKSRWAWEQDTCPSMLTISSFILDSDGWKQWR